jgi:branched-chain amino acid transport system ATP-binding protein
MLKVEDGEVSGGAVRYAGADLAGRDVQQRVAGGIVHVVEGRKVLRHMTAEQNLIVGGHLQPNLAAVRRGLDQVYETIPRLADLRSAAPPATSRAVSSSCC